MLEAPLLLANGDWSSFRREKRLYVQLDNAAALLGPTPVPENFDSKQRERFLKRSRLLVESFTLEIESAETWPPHSEAVLLAARDGESDEQRAERSLRARSCRARFAGRSKTPNWPRLSGCIGRSGRRGRPGARIHARIYAAMAGPRRARAAGTVGPPTRPHHRRRA